MDVEKLGADAIKEQQHINLKFSSNAVAIISEDQAQCMLAGISFHFLLVHLNTGHISHTFISHSNVSIERSHCYSLCNFCNIRASWSKKLNDYTEMQ